MSQSPMPSNIALFKPRSNPALNPVRFALWTLRDKAVQAGEFKR